MKTTDEESVKKSCSYHNVGKEKVFVLYVYNYVNSFEVLNCICRS